MNIVAVKADGYTPETKVITVSYTTKENLNKVTFNASPEKFWTAGTYRVDISINGKIADSLSFEIEEKTTETKNKTKPKKPKS